MTEWVLLVRTDTGRWYWWRTDAIVGFLPKGHRIPTVTLSLPQGWNTVVGALRRVVRFLPPPPPDA